MGCEYGDRKRYLTIPTILRDCSKLTSSQVVLFACSYRIRLAGFKDCIPGVSVSLLDAVRLCSLGDGVVDTV